MNAADCGLPTLDYSGTTNGITESGRILKSPLYGLNGNPYLPDTDCTYTIRNHPSFSVPEYFLAVHFLSSVTFKVPGIYPECSDYLEITIGERNPKTIKYCGDKTPPPTIYSHEGVVKIRVVGSPATDGGVFQFEATARKRDFGSTCLYHRQTGTNGLIISTKYPYEYSNGTCDQRIFVGSKNDIDLHFVDINLKSDSGNGECQSGSDRDHVEIRGSLFVTTFEDATPLGQVKCGNVSELYSLKKIEFDYVYVRFYANKMAPGYRGVYAVYNIYETPKKPIQTDSTSTLLWVSIVCGVILIIIILWVFIYRALNSKKKQRRAVEPMGVDDGQDGTGYVPNIPLKTIKHREGDGMSPPTAPPMMGIMTPSMEEPDYNPADLFAAVKHRVATDTLPDDLQNGDEANCGLDGVLFPRRHGDGVAEGEVEECNDLTAGLSPGYMTSYGERQTSGLMNT